MFENAGNKIKAAAKILVWAEIVIVCIIGTHIFILTRGDYAFYTFLGIAGGVVFAWLFNLVLYAFGELVCKIAGEQAVQSGDEPEEIPFVPQEQPVELSEEDFVDVRCPGCDRTVSFLNDTETAVCPYCNATISL